MPRVLQRLILTATCLVALVLASALRTQIWPGIRVDSSAWAQDTGETSSINVDRYPKGRLDPVEVTQIMEGDRVVTPGVYRVPPNDTVGQPIPYGDDWIDKLSYTFKNLTSRKIEFMSVGLRFYYGDHSDWHRRGIWHLHLGQVPPLAVATYFTRKGEKSLQGTGHPLEFGPGEEITIPLARGFAEEIKAKIQAVAPLSAVTRCVVAVNLVFFDQPGLKWGNYGFGWAVADPNSSNGYRKMGWDFPLDVNHATWDKPPRAGQPDSN